MRNEYIFPVVLIVLMCGAAIVYAASGDYKMAVYWTCVALANVMVTF